MEKIDFEIKQGIKAHLIKTNLFKTNVFSVIITTPLERINVTKIAQMGLITHLTILIYVKII